MGGERESGGGGGGGGCDEPFIAEAMVQGTVYKNLKGCGFELFRRAVLVEDEGGAALVLIGRDGGLQDLVPEGKSRGL